MTPRTGRPPVFVAGVGETGPATADSRSIPEMVLEAVDAALADAGCTHDDIDGVVTASVDLFDGLTASNIAVTEVVGAVMKPESRIAGDGLAAVIHAACQLWAESYRTVLVVGHAKPSMAAFQDLTTWAMDPITLQPLGVDFLTCAALQASAIQAGDADADRRWADTAARQRTAAAAHGGLAVTCSSDDVLSSPVVASPLREGMCAPLADGACALVLRTGGDARGPRITGVGHDMAPHALGDRQLTAWEGAERAYARACATAGLAVGDRAFDLVEPSCTYAHEEELFLTATNVSPDSLSPTGGLFGGAVPVVAGMSRVAVATRRMRSDAGCSRALVHGAWGPAGQAHAMAILEAA